MCLNGRISPTFIGNLCRICSWDWKDLSLPMFARGSYFRSLVSWTSREGEVTTIRTIFRDSRVVAINRGAAPSTHVSTTTLSETQRIWLQNVWGVSTQRNGTLPVTLSSERSAAEVNVRPIKFPGEMRIGSDVQGMMASLSRRCITSLSAALGQYRE